MQGNSLFDAATFLETQYPGLLSTDYVLPTERDYRAQTTDQITTRSGIIGPTSERAGDAWASVELQWELLDEDERKRMNVDRILVRQGIMIDLDQKLWHSTKAIVPDFGINRNMRLKRLLEATGLNTLKHWSWNMLKHQQGFVSVRHVRPDGFDDSVAEVFRVVSIKRASPNGPA